MIQYNNSDLCTYESLSPGVTITTHTYIYNSNKNNNNNSLQAGVPSFLESVMAENIKKKVPWD